jgi:hypothetical protein
MYVNTAQCTMDLSSKLAFSVTLWLLLFLKDPGVYSATPSRIEGRLERSFTSSGIVYIRYQAAARIFSAQRMDKISALGRSIHALVESLRDLLQRAYGIVAVQ